MTNRTRRQRLLGGVIILAVLALGVAACTVDTNEGEAAILFEGRTGQVKTYSGCLGPLQRRGGDDGNDEAYRYPAGQRDFTFTGGDGADQAPIQVVTKDNVVLTLGGTATFALNISCNDDPKDGGTLKRFHDNIGRRYNPDPGQRLEDTPGWDQIKVKYLGGPLEASMDAFAKQYNWKELYQDPAKKQEFLTKVAADAPNRVKQATGSNESYFCGPSFLGSGECGGFIIQIPSVQPPSSVLNAMAQDAANKEINTAAASEAETRAKLIKELGPQGYLEYQALQIVKECNQRPAGRECKMSPPVQYVPQGGGVIVDGRAR